MDHVVAAFAMYHDPSVGDVESALEHTYMVLPEGKNLLMELQTGMSTLNLDDPIVPGDSVAALPADDSEPKEPEPHGTKRSASWDAVDEVDLGEGWGKRVKKNKPDGMSEKTWYSGVSHTEQPGWSKLVFMYAPKSAWKTAVRWVHATTTVADVKWELESEIQIPHNKFCCFGLNSQRKLPFTEELTSASSQNRDPLEKRVCVPTCAEFAPYLCGGLQTVAMACLFEVSVCSFLHFIKVAVCCICVYRHSVCFMCSELRLIAEQTQTPIEAVPADGTTAVVAADTQDHNISNAHLRTIAFVPKCFEMSVRFGWLCGS